MPPAPRQSQSLLSVLAKEVLEGQAEQQPAASVQETPPETASAHDSAPVSVDAIAAPRASTAQHASAEFTAVAVASSALAPASGSCLNGACGAQEARKRVDTGARRKWWRRLRLGCLGPPRPTQAPS